MASSSTSSIEKSFKYPVFLSFRGPDTRTNIVGHLYAALKRQGIYTFKDDVELEKGKNIDELFKAIKESKFFIVVFSKNYASSSWCLRELAKIMEYQKTTEQIVFPIFYGVDPAHVRKRIGHFGRAFAKHKNDQVGEWKKALEDAGNLVGWDLRNRDEAEAINEIVEKISVNLRSFHVGNDKNLIGMDPQIKKVLSFLETSTDDVRMIGIKGQGGVGKTTLARAVFDKVSFRFEGVSFIEDVREVSKAGLLSLQQRIFANVSKGKPKCEISSVHDGINFLPSRLCHIKVLIVLDDVDHIDQLKALAGATDWFKEGSRIIITTRDEQVLKPHGVNAKWIHDVDFLKDEEALSLFNRCAFRGYIPAQGYEELSSEVVRYAAGLPLTLKVLGATLFGKEKRVWMEAVDRLKEIPCEETLKQLEISYIGLEDNLKEIFLNVACFIKGLRIDDAIRILESCKLYPIYGLKVLEEKSLVTISNQCLGMHNSIEEMGKIIVRRNLTGEPNKHSRLWIREEIEKLLSDDVGTEATTHIRLDQVELSPEKVMEGLGKLKKLRVLLLTGRDDACSHNDWKFDQAKQYFSNTLQFLRWEGYPVWSLPQTFRADNLVGLELPRSRITELRESGNKKVLNFNKLRFLDLSYSMLELLDLGMTPNLERLDLKECHDLTELRVSNGCPERLVYLNLIGCSKFKKSFSFFKRLESCKLLSLRKLVLKLEPQGPQRYSRSNLPELRCTCFYLEEQASSIENSQKSVSLNLQPRTKLESFSGSICGLQHLRHLTLDGCIPEVPKDIDQLAYLEKLSLLSARIRCLPGTICMLKHLKSLELKSCELLEELPVELGSLERLEELSLLSTGIRRLPDSICSLKQLKSLTLKSCLHLAELPDNLGHLECLEKLNLLSERIKHLPDSVCRLKQLKSLELESCRLLEKLPEGLGHLHCLEKLTLTKCASLVDIPISICDMKRLRCLHLPYCLKVEKLPEELGRLECLKELDVKFTGISHLPQSISSLIDLRVVGSEAVLQSCAFATQIQTSETETFCYIRAVENTSNGTELTNQVTENFSNRWTKMSCVYVGNLDPRVSKRELEDEFQVYGVLRNVWVARRPRGYAFVEFDDRRDALDAIRALDGKNGWRVKLFHNSKEVGGGGRGGARGRRGGGGDDLKCYECGEPGHFARECFLRVGPRGLGSGRRRSPSPRRRRSPSFGRRSYSPRYSPHGRRSTPRRSISPYRARSSRSPPPYRRARCDSRYAIWFKF